MLLAFLTVLILSLLTQYDNPDQSEVSPLCHQEELELVLSFAGHLDRLLPADPTSVPSAAVFLNFSNLLMKAAYQARTAPLAAGLLLASLRQLLLSRPTEEKLSQTVYQVSEWGKSRPPAATAADLPAEVLTLADTAPPEQRLLLVFVAARLACCGALPSGPFTARLRQVSPRSGGLRLVCDVFGAAAGLPAGEGEMGQLLEGDQLAGEALFTVYHLLQQLAATTGSGRPPVSYTGRGRHSQVWSVIRSAELLF